MEDAVYSTNTYTSWFLAEVYFQIVWLFVLPLTSKSLSDCSQICNHLIYLKDIKAKLLNRGTM